MTAHLCKLGGVVSLIDINKWGVTSRVCKLGGVVSPLGLIESYNACMQIRGRGFPSLGLKNAVGDIVLM